LCCWRSRCGLLWGRRSLGFTGANLPRCRLTLVPQQLEDRPGRGGDPVHAVSPKVRVLLRRDDEHVPRRQCSDHLVKVERNLLQATLVPCCRAASAWQWAISSRSTPQKLSAASILSGLKATDRGRQRRTAVCQFFFLPLSHFRRYGGYIPRETDY